MCDIGQRLQLALASKNNCDVHLLLQSGDSFQCHSLILSLSCTFFESKLKDYWCENENEKKISCVDFEDNFVIEMVKFMYGIPCHITYANIEGYLSCANYYGVDELVTKCDDYITENVTVNNVFKFLRIANCNARQECISVCYKFIDHNFETCLFDDGEFCLLSPELIHSIVERESLNAHEEFLFSCLRSYADVVDSFDILQLCADCIRFTSMSLEFFVSECALHKFLKEDVEKQILQFLSSAEYAIPDVYLPPRNIVLRSDIFVPRVQSISTSASWQSHPLNGDRIQFKCSSAMTLKAISVYGLQSSSLFYNLSVHESSTGQLLSQCSCRLHFSNDELFKYIRLKKCLPVESNKLYTIALTSKGKSTYSGERCLSSTMIEKCGEVVRIAFENASCGSSSVENGQFHGFLFCEVKELIKLYFRQGYNYRLIHYLLESRHQYTISFSYLQKKIIPSLGLKRRGALSADIADIFTISVNEVNNGVAGAEQLRRTLSMKYQLQIPRQLSREVVRVIDPDGLERRKKHRLRRRQYFSKGPNYAWHLDGYDKLGPYGVYIHGCIDGFSRKVVWLKAGVTNRRPEVVGQYFVEAVVNEGGFPKRVRGDNGSENGLVARIQREVLDDESAFRYGKSTSNQLLQQRDLFIKEDPMHRMCLQYAFMPFIQKQLDETRSIWNSHPIRNQRNGDVMPGIPDILHTQTQLFGVQNFLTVVPDAIIQQYSQQCTNQFLMLDQDFCNVVGDIIHSTGLPDPMDIETFEDAKCLYIVLKDIVRPF